LPKFSTIVIDSAHELARLTFSKDMGKHASQSMDPDAKIRQINNYPGATERINMMVRRFKDYQKNGITMLITAHEQLEKVYARGGIMAKGGQNEPLAVKGWPNLPGSTCPTEVMGACDNVFRMRRINGKPQWICIEEPIGSGGPDVWVAKDRFNAPILAPNTGILPPDYNELAKLADANSQCTWRPPYIWMIYGPPGVGKTRSILSFPKPIRLFDIDRGASVLSDKAGNIPDFITVTQYNSEECDDYPQFLSDLEAANA
jgi:hypothetical protein